MRRGASPYGTIDEDLAIWSAYHRLDDQWRDAGLREPPVRPGPYLYPPTLALIIAQTGIGPVAFAAVIVLSLTVFISIWLKATGMHAMWLLFVVLSWDIFASASGGNAELVVLGSTMAAARILWSAQPVLAAPFIAFLLLIKPFYFLFFAAFVVMLLCTRHPAPNRTVAALAATAVTTLARMGVELHRWGPTLLAEALAFLRNGIKHSWFVLPVAEQTRLCRELRETARQRDALLRDGDAELLRRELDAIRTTLKREQQRNSALARENALLRDAQAIAIRVAVRT